MARWQRLRSAIVDDNERREYACSVELYELVAARALTVVNFTQAALATEMSTS
jgi:hypothetical protein